MLRLPSANSLVVRVDCIVFATGVSDGRLQYPLLLRNGVILEEDMFYTPKASSSESCNLDFISCSSFKISRKNCIASKVITHR